MPGSVKVHGELPTTGHSEGEQWLKDSQLSVLGTIAAMAGKVSTTERHG